MSDTSSSDNLKRMRHSRHGRFTFSSNSTPDLSSRAWLRSRGAARRSSFTSPAPSTRTVDGSQVVLWTNRGSGYEVHYADLGARLVFAYSIAHDVVKLPSRAAFDDCSPVGAVT